MCAACWCVPACAAREWQRGMSCADRPVVWPKPCSPPPAHLGSAPFSGAGADVCCSDTFLLGCACPAHTRSRTPTHFQAHMALHWEAGRAAELLAPMAVEMHVSVHMHALTLVSTWRTWPYSNTHTHPHT